jgi:hypothetical protein
VRCRVVFITTCACLVEEFLFGWLTGGYALKKGGSGGGAFRSRFVRVLRLLLVVWFVYLFT